MSVSTKFSCLIGLDLAAKVPARETLSSEIALPGALSLIMARQRNHVAESEAIRRAAYFDLSRLGIELTKIRLW